MSTAFLAADVGRDIVSGSGYGTITGYTSTTVVTVTILADFPSNNVPVGQWKILGSPMTTCTPGAASPVGTITTLTLGAAGWRAEDVGKYVSINGGLMKITSFTSTTVVNASIERVLTGVVAAPALAWILMGSVWGGLNGYPSCGTFYEQRFCLGGSPGFPQTLWMSHIGESFNFELGTDDDDAISYTLASNELNPIVHLAEAQGLIAFTYGGEFSIRGGQEKPLTPTNIQVKNPSNYGCSDVAPARVAGEVYFTQRAGRKIRGLSPDQFNTERYNAPDMSVLSEHVTEGGVVDMAFQQEPDGVVFVPRADGQVATLTVDRDQEVIAWARQVTNGIVESVASIPTSDGDRTFAIVARVIDGVTVRYQEMFDRTLMTDAALTGTSVGGATVWTGLDHLEGRTVNVKGDGVVLQDRVVTGGQITIERIAYAIEIGLNYISTILTLTPEIPSAGGSSQGSNLSVHEVIVRLRDTIGCTINGQVVPFRALGQEVLDTPIQPFTGDKKAGNLGWNEGKAQTLIQQIRPYPFHVLAVISKITVNDG